MAARKNPSHSLEERLAISAGMKRMHARKRAERERAAGVGISRSYVEQLTAELRR